ncbi:Uncharacterised protein [uncultured archaeon]|nr:Uncharacterised protein [uncultured archaeon]
MMGLRLTSVLILRGLVISLTFFIMATGPMAITIPGVSLASTSSSSSVTRALRPTEPLSVQMSSSSETDRISSSRIISSSVRAPMMLITRFPICLSLLAIG